MLALCTDFGPVFGNPPNPKPPKSLPNPKIQSLHKWITGGLILAADPEPGALSSGVGSFWVERVGVLEVYIHIYIYIFT